MLPAAVAWGGEGLAEFAALWGGGGDAEFAQVEAVVAAAERERARNEVAVAVERARATAAAAARDGTTTQDESKCVVCLARERTHVFVPCGHRCVCPSCAHLVMQRGADDGRGPQCPACRAPVACPPLRVWL
jgi:hypothetical protein